MKCTSISLSILLLGISSAFGLYSTQLPASQPSVPSANPPSIPTSPTALPEAKGHSSGANVSSSGGIFESTTSERFADRIFDPKSDSIDFEKGTFVWKGKSFDVGNSKMVRARFERYLAMPQITSSYANYQNIISEIESNLSAANDRLSHEKLRPVWRRLFDAAEYDVDGGACMSIANLVYNSWRMRNEIFSATSSIAEIEQDKKLEEKLLSAATMKMELRSDFHTNINTNKSGVKELSFGKGALAEKIKKIKEKTAALAVAEANAGVLNTKAVLQFQSQIMIFMLERKFQQAQIASMFYRHIYRSSAQDFRSGMKELFASFDMSTFVPTIDSVESLANDARKDIKDGMATVENLYTTGMRYSALIRLLETFALGENDPVLLSFEESKRRVLLDIYRTLATLKEVAESRDFESVDLCVKKIQALASDFPAMEINAKVNAAKRASSMYIMSARQAAFAGDMKSAKASLAEAVKIWPLNPEIAKFNAEAMSAATGESKYSEKFDDAIKAKNYRAIQEEAPEFSIALRSQPEKLKLLRKIVVDMTKLDAFIAQAREMVKQNNYYLAWDILESALQIDANDVVLANERAKLAPEVADYVKLLNRAKKAEADGKFALALNYYLAAKSLSPASSQCRIGIEKLSPVYAK